MKVSIGYVDGVTEEGSPEEWSHFRSDGVDWIEVDNIRIAAQSVYWLRRIVDGWCAGGASYHEQEPFEVEITEYGQREIPIRRDNVPDLHHSEVKLGWWWRG